MEQLRPGRREHHPAGSCWVCHGLLIHHWIFFPELGISRRLHEVMPSALSIESPCATTPVKRLWFHRERALSIPAPGAFLRCVFSKPQTSFSGARKAAPGHLPHFFLLCRVLKFIYISRNRGKKVIKNGREMVLGIVRTPKQGLEVSLTKLSG